MLRKMFLLVVCVLCLSSCKENDETAMNEHEYSKYIIDEITNSVNNRDEKRLKELFSKSVVENVTDLDEQIMLMFDYIDSKISLNQYDECIASSMSIEDGKKSNMMRFSFEIITDEDQKFNFFIICYNIDMLNEDNKGVYMIEVAKSNYDEYTSWQERMVQGISILYNREDTKYE